MAIGNPIESNPVLQRHARKLRALGYADVDTVAGAVTGASARMADYLADDVSVVLRGMNEAVQVPRQFQLGVALDQIPSVQVAFAMAAPAAAPLPASVSLIPHMPPIRDQANRGTCVAHAALAALENLRTLQGAFEDMSEQFLYWNSKQHDGVPTQPGTYLGVAIPLLRTDGCCREVTWRYNPTPIAGNEGQGPAAAPASAEAAVFRILSYQTLAPTSVIDIKRELARDRCVPFSIPVFNSWYQNNAVVSSGDIVLPFPGEAVAGGHAMCICGYLDDPAEDDIGGGRFILRNSWDSAWGTASVHGVGYGTIPYAYISRFGREAYSIE